MKSGEEFRRRVGDVSSDEFALLVSLPHLSIRVPPVTQESGGGRLRRFTLSVPLAYRLGTDLRWRRGVTENVSHGGLLFRTRSIGGLRGAALGQRGIPVEILLELKGATCSERGWRSSDRMGPRCGDGRGPTGAMRRRAILGCSWDSGAPRNDRGSGWSGRAAGSRNGQRCRLIATPRSPRGPVPSDERSTCSVGIHPPRRRARGRSARGSCI